MSIATRDWRDVAERRRAVRVELPDFPHRDERVPLVTFASYIGAAAVFGIIFGLIVGGQMWAPAATECVRTPVCMEALNR